MNPNKEYTTSPKQFLTSGFILAVADSCNIKRKKAAKIIPYNTDEWLGDSETCLSFQQWWQTNYDSLSRVTIHIVPYQTSQYSENKKIFFPRPLQRENCNSRNNYPEDVTILKEHAVDIFDAVRITDIVFNEETSDIDFSKTFLNNIYRQMISNTPMGIEHSAKFNEGFAKRVEPAHLIMIGGEDFNFPDRFGVVFFLNVDGWDSMLPHLNLFGYGKKYASGLLTFPDMEKYSQLFIERMFVFHDPIDEVEKEINKRINEHRLLIKNAHCWIYGEHARSTLERLKINCKQTTRLFFLMCLRPDFSHEDKAKSNGTYLTRDGFKLELNKLSSIVSYTEKLSREKIICRENICLNQEIKQISIDETILSLTTQEYFILEYILRSQGWGCPLDIESFLLFSSIESGISNCNFRDILSIISSINEKLKDRTSVKVEIINIGHEFINLIHYVVFNVLKQ